jgi:glycosyltransferase involved in cell wall biosynthesis
VRRAGQDDAAGLAFKIDRGLNRWWDYPRRLRAIASSFDVFHVVDHTYAHLVHALPPEKTVVTCHDIDTFRSLFYPTEEPRSPLFRAMARRILEGLSKAARVSCDTAAIRNELVAHGAVDPDRVTVVPVGVSGAFTSTPQPDDADLVARTGLTENDVVLLHVGSTIARKRIDVLLETFAAVRQRVPNARLVRVGSPLTADQTALGSALGIGDRVLSLGAVDETTLAAMYRRAALVLQPSSREGFGLPLIEALASGTPVVATAIATLREVGGDAATYCPLGDSAAWADTIVVLLAERRQAPERWRARVAAGCARARCFTWARYSDRMIDIYRSLAA